MEINLPKEKRVFMDLGNDVEMLVHFTKNGTVTISLDGANMQIMPKAGNVIELKLEK